MTNRRDDTFVTFARVVDKLAAAAVHFLCDHATPRHSMIDQLSILFVVIVGSFTGFEILFGALAIGPGFAAVKLVEFTFAFGIPRVEKLARIPALRPSFSFAFGKHLFGRAVLIFLIELVRNLDLLFGFVHRNRLKQHVHAARR